MDASVTSPVHTTKDAHYKGYTTLLPNICIYDMNASTNKCTCGVQGRPKTMYQCTLSTTFPPKKGEINRKKPNRTENHQYLPKLVLQNSEFVNIQNNKSQEFIFPAKNIKKSNFSPNWPENGQFPPKSVVYKHKFIC